MIAALDYQTGRMDFSFPSCKQKALPIRLKKEYVGLEFPWAEHALYTARRGTGNVEHDSQE
jgi:hypothetical protein